MGRYVNFNKLKEAVTLRDILDYYKIPHTGEGVQLAAKCPFHEGDGLSLKANNESGLFMCHGCKTKGKLFDFVMEKEDIENVRDAAIFIEDFILRTKNETPKQDEPKANAPIVGDTLEKIRKNLRTPKLEGFKTETLERFGCGTCVRGVNQGKLAVPVHTKEGNVLAYIGLKEGVWSFKNFTPGSDLYNLNRALSADMGFIAITEDPRDVWRMSDQGFQNAVATFGAGITDAQMKQLGELLPHETRVFVLTTPVWDVDALLKRMMKLFFVKVYKLEGRFFEDPKEILAICHN